jgi:signal transduction histidine kinase
MPRITRSISLHIILSTVTVLLTLALLVGWTLVIVQNMNLRGVVAGNVWLLVGGIAFFIVIMTVLVMFSVFLVREILEGRRQQTFMDSVTHELKSPLASIKLCLDTLARPEVNAAQREKLRQMMLGDVDRLSVFVDDVLEASRLSHGHGTPAWTPISVPALVQRCVDTVRHRYNLAADAIEIHMQENLNLVTDATALETIMRNLLDNAVKYSGPEPRIRVTVQAVANDRLEFAVSDEGIGIAKTHLKQIFKRFYRVPSEEVYERSGTGLGLYVVAALVRNLGGRIEARSAGPHRGTCILVQLPAMNERANAATPTSR